MAVGPCAEGYLPADYAGQRVQAVESHAGRHDRQRFAAGVDQDRAAVAGFRLRGRPAGFAGGEVEADDPGVLPKPAGHAEHDGPARWVPHDQRRGAEAEVAEVRPELFGEVPPPELPPVVGGDAPQPPARPDRQHPAGLFPQQRRVGDGRRRTRSAVARHTAAVGGGGVGSPQLITGRHVAGFQPQRFTDAVMQEDQPARDRRPRVPLPHRDGPERFGRLRQRRQRFLARGDAVPIRTEQLRPVAGGGEQQEERRGGGHASMVVAECAATGGSVARHDTLPPVAANRLPSPVRRGGTATRPHRRGPVARPRPARPVHARARRGV